MDPTAENDFRAFVEARSGALLGTALLLTGNRASAEDLLQIALVRLHRHWARVSSNGQPEPYVRKIMINERSGWWRRHRGREVLVAAVPEREVVGDGTSAFAERDRIWQALQALPPRTRAVIVLRYWEDRSVEETADLLGCSTGTVRSAASRGLRRLAAVLEPNNDAVGAKGGEAR